MINFSTAISLECFHIDKTQMTATSMSQSSSAMPLPGTKSPGQGTMGSAGGRGLTCGVECIVGIVVGISLMIAFVIAMVTMVVCVYNKN